LLPFSLRSTPSLSESPVRLSCCLYILITLQPFESESPVRLLAAFTLSLISTPLRLYQPYHHVFPAPCTNSLRSTPSCLNSCLVILLAAFTNVFHYPFMSESP